jgi:AmmeMemoRadiSam system protein B
VSTSTLKLTLAIIGLIALIGVLVTGKSSKIQVSGFVVSHHDFVKGQRDDLYKTLSAKIKQPDTIILISPNHYDVGKSAIQTTTQGWEVTGGRIEPNEEFINYLLRNGATDEPDSFINEHGIHLQLADIHQYFPKARLVPLILKSSITLEETRTLEAELNAKLPDALLIASVDFSHYQPALLAQLHDDLTERYLDTLDSDKLYRESEVNCPSCLATLTLWAKDHGTEKFTIKDHTNSGIILKDADIETTTHFFAWYEKGARTPPQSSVTFSLAGRVKPQGDPARQFSLLGDRTFWGTDISLLPSGNSQTTQYLKAVDYDTIENPLLVQGQNLILAIFHYTTGIDPTDISRQIRELKKDSKYKVIVFADWSAPESIHTSMAYGWIDAGADLVVGLRDQSGGVESYKGKPIVYALGDLTGGNSLILSGKFEDKSLHLVALPAVAPNGQPALLRGEPKAHILEDILGAFPGNRTSTPFGQFLSFPE